MDIAIECFVGKASAPRMFSKLLSWLLVPALCVLVVIVQITNLVLGHTVYTWQLVPIHPGPPVCGTAVLSRG